MLKKICVVCILVCLFFNASAQDTAIMKFDSALYYRDYHASWDSLMHVLYPPLPVDSAALNVSKTITGKDLRMHLTELTSPKYEGRETGYPGQKEAEKYLSAKLKFMGVKPGGENNTYIQSYHLKEDTVKRVVFQVNSKNYEHYKDFYSYINFNRNDSTEADKIYFGGYGIEDEKYNDYKDLDAKGSILMIHQGEPQINDSTYLLSGNSTPSAWSTRWESKMKAATDKGVKMLLVVVKNAKEDVDNNFRIKNRPMRFETDSSERSQYCNVYYISRDMAVSIFESAGKDYNKFEKKLTASSSPKGLKLKVKARVVYTKVSIKRTSSNVLGIIEGSDKKDEFVVYSAHYDHLGMHDGVIFPGADDDGSGTVGLLEIAQAYTLAKKIGKGPRRSILFIFFSGEEKGLLGSEYYSQHPVHPLENTVVDLNIDMIGRCDEAHENTPNYVYIIGDDKLSSELRGISEKANNTYQKMDLDYKYNVDNEPNHYYTRSDHYNFAKKGIPIIFYFNGTHKDYHKPSDTLNKINFGKLMFTAKLAFFTGWDIANREERLKADKK